MPKRRPLTLPLPSSFRSLLSIVFFTCTVQTAVVGFRTPFLLDCKTIAAPIRRRQRFANCPSLIELALFSSSHKPRHCDPLRFRYSFHIHLRRSPKFGMIYSPAKESAYCIERRNSRQSLFSSGWNIRRKGGTKKNSADSETVRLVLCFQLRKSVRHSISKSLTAALTPTEK